MKAEILLYDGCDELDVFGPYEVLTTVEDPTGSGPAVRLVTLDGAPVVCAHGVRLIADSRLSDESDLLIVPGGGWLDDARLGARAEAASGKLPRAIAARHSAGTTVASVCTGAMLLASAGLMRGRPAVTHHNALADLRRAGATVIAQARVVDDGDLLSAGGVTCGIDLGLWLLARQLGEHTAAATAQELEYNGPSAVWCSKHGWLRSSEETHAFRPAR